jgi:tetratricopeptide (TPR) repeat protein
VLVCIAGGVIAALIGGGGADTDAHRGAATASKHSTSTKHKAATSSKAKAHTTSTAAASTPAATPQNTTTTAAPPASDAQSAGALNDAGYAKLQAGDAAGAIPLLQQSVAKYRAAGDRSLGFAYALYNLAVALRETGHADQAIPLLQERLGFSNDRRGLIEQELQRDQQLAGQAPSDGKGKGKKPKKG